MKARFQNPRGLLFTILRGYLFFAFNKESTVFKADVTYNHNKTLNHAAWYLEKLWYAYIDADKFSLYKDLFLRFRITQTKPKCSSNSVSYITYPTTCYLCILNFALFCIDIYQLYGSVYQDIHKCNLTIGWELKTTTLKS